MSPSVFKVLSIDGGGIKGVYTAAMLRELEHALARIEGHSRLGEYFDLICGTSTGALIALGLAAGRTCDEIAETYLVKAHRYSRIKTDYTRQCSPSANSCYPLDMTTKPSVQRSRICLVTASSPNPKTTF